MQWFIGLISLWHLCGSRKGNGTLRKTCWDPQALRAYGSSSSKRIYALPVLEYSPAPCWGDSHGRQREYRSVMNGSLLRLSGLPSTQARPATAWGSLWECCGCCPWGTGHPDTVAWLPQAEPGQALVAESEMWSLLLLPVRVPNTFTVKYGWVPLLTAQVYPSRTRWNTVWEVS